MQEVYIHPWVTLGIEEEIKTFNKITFIELEQKHKYEIIKQAFDLFDLDSTTIFTKARSFIKYEQVFSYYVNQDIRNQVNEVVFEITIGLYLKCYANHLFIKNDHETTFFPYFLMNISSTTALLRADLPFKNNLI